MDLEQLNIKAASSLCTDRSLTLEAFANGVAFGRLLDLLEGSW